LADIAVVLIVAAAEREVDHLAYDVVVDCIDVM
jgi:hypothetical protein